MSFGGLMFLHFNDKYCGSSEWLCSAIKSKNKSVGTVKPIADLSSTNSKTVEYCDKYEGLCFSYKSNWTLVENTDPRPDVADGSKAISLSSKNGTIVMYASGMLTALNDTNKNCNNTGYEDMRPYIISRQPSSNLAGVDIIQFAWNDQQISEVRTSLIAHEYEPGSIVGGSCGTMTTTRTDDQGQLRISTTQLTSFVSNKHPKQYMVFATSAAAKSEDLQDVKNMLASAHYK